MTYLITGGTGFIGSRVVRDLVRNGEDVVVLDWYPEKIALQRILNEEEIDQIDYQDLANQNLSKIENWSCHEFAGVMWL